MMIDRNKTNAKAEYMTFENQYVKTIFSSKLNQNNIIEYEPFLTLFNPKYLPII